MRHQHPVRKVDVTNRVNKYQIALTPNSKSEIYDGTGKSVSGFESLEFEIDGRIYTIFGIEASVKATEVGEYPVDVTDRAVVADSEGTTRPTSLHSISRTAN